MDYELVTKDNGTGENRGGEQKSNVSRMHMYLRRLSVVTEVAEEAKQKWAQVHVMTSMMGPRKQRI